MNGVLSDLGERKIIQLVRAQYGYGWPDDDAAYIDIGKEYLLITTDSISQSAHMPKGARWESVGYFFAALNLSDIAAMGGKPEYLITAFTLPRKMRIDDLKRLEVGMKRCLEKYGVKLFGGDTKEGMEINLTGVAIGTVAKKNILRRDGVRKGDVVCVTGSLGKNGAGYYMWKKTGLRRWAELLLDIEPRIDEGVLIAKSGATAAIDLSDGLFSAILQLSKINRCGFEIDYPKVPIHYAAKSAGISTGVNVEDIALNFGGDYELLFTIQKSKLNHLLSEAKKNGIRVSVIGKVAGRKCMLVKDGKKVGIRKAGYEHFR